MIDSRQFSRSVGRRQLETVVSDGEGVYRHAFELSFIVVADRAGVVGRGSDDSVVDYASGASPVHH